MIKKIQLSISHGRLLDREPFIVATGETLELELISKQPPEEWLIKARNGGEEKQYRCRGTRWQVPAELIRAGALDISVGEIARAELVKTYSVEPIIIKELSVGFEGHPEFNDIARRLDELTKKYGEVIAYSKRLEAFGASLDAQKQYLDGVGSSVEKITGVLAGYNPIP